MIPLPWAAAVAGVAGSLMLPLEPRHGGRVAIAGRVAMLAPLVLLIAIAGASPARTACTAALVIALLARRAHDPFHTECALKVLWVAGVALALSMAGHMLFTALTGTPRPEEDAAAIHQR